MASNPNLTIISWIVDYLGRNRSVPSLDFKTDELVKPLTPLKIPWWGCYLSMPSATSAVIIPPDGKQKVYISGGMLNLPPGRYGVKYVDMRQHSMSLHSIQAKSSDAWQVSLTIEVTWQVKDPLVVANMSQPLQTLADLCMAATINFIQSNPHDGLVSTPETKPMEENQIGLGILKRLTKNTVLRGFDFINVNVLGRQGDPQRTEKIQQAMVKVEELKREQEVTREKVGVAREQESLAVQEARTSRLADKTQAEFDAMIAEILLPVQKKTIEIQQLSASQQLKQEQILKAMEISGSALSQLASVLSQAQVTPGLQHDLDNRTLETMLHFMQALSRVVPDTPDSKKLPPEPPRILPAVDVKDFGE